MKIRQDNNHQAFFALLRAGLWADANLNLDVSLLCEQSNLGRANDKVDWEKVYQLAEDQSVIGVVLAGIEHSTFKPSQELLLQWIGEVQMLEQQNKAMNQFIADLVERLRKFDIYTLLVKGQGIAQCYDRPLWRTPGDVDLLLSDAKYSKAENLLMPLASIINDEISYAKHKAFVIDEWTVELHGSLRSGLWRKIDCELDQVQYDIFCGGNVRSWLNGKTQIFIPRADEDVMYVFSHILQHFFKEGVGLRQICDWCRLLWRFKDKLDYGLLELRIRKAGLVTEWKAFAALAVDYLGMPSETMPMYSPSSKWSNKALKIMEFILETGNFGHNRDYGYYDNYSYLMYKTISFWKHIKDGYRYFHMFPLDSQKVMARRIVVGFSVVLRGKRHE